MEPDDVTLMEGVRADREGAFEEFVERYQRRLYRLAHVYLRNHEDALDAVQETMIKIYVARRRYRPESHPFTWVSRILANHCIDRIRRRRSHPAESLEAVREESPGREPAPSGRWTDEAQRTQEGRELRRQVEQAMAGLPENQREVFVLRHFEEMSLAEIAAARGCALGTVKSSLHRAAAAVRDHLLRSGLLPGAAEGGTGSEE
ncbi:MAG TPA: sigma-70 family RNA polymerase sigma factor [Candidatus Polarisedimenticolia bacterium]|nr:sigma-70 family RNA polymerase sigma factor [Candidatus Polarisedimenticolia bacterium]